MINIKTVILGYTLLSHINCRKYTTPPTFPNFSTDSLTIFSRLIPLGEVCPRKSTKQWSKCRKSTYFWDRLAEFEAKVD